MSTEADTLRAALVQELTRKRGLGDERVAAVVGEVPRHLFVPHVEVVLAYSDRAIPTHWSQGLPTSSASQPAIVATMLELLEPHEGASVLEVGAGTGYNAALLARLVGAAGRVVSLEIDPEIASEARANLRAADVANVEVVCGDGYDGYADAAPFDRIIVTAGASDLSPAWFEQLSADGRLVLPLSIRGDQQCVSFAKHPDGHLRSVATCECRFMPLRGAMANSELRLPVRGYPGVFVYAAPDATIDVEVVAGALSRPGRLKPTGISARFLEISGSLRRWLAYRDLRSIELSYIGPTEGAEANPVPRVLNYPLPGAAQWSTLALVGGGGLATLERTGPGTGEGLDEVIRLAIRPFGDAAAEVRMLEECLDDWNAAGRRGRPRVDAYARPLPWHPDPSSVHRAEHTTFVVSW